MFSKLLVATDGSERSRKAIDAAVALALKLGAPLVGVTAVDERPRAGAGPAEPEGDAAFQAAASAQARNRLAVVEQAAFAAGVPCTVLSHRGGPPWSAILDTADDHACDAIVMASHGRRGVGALLLASETQYVLAKTALPVIVVR